MATGILPGNHKIGTGKHIATWSRTPGTTCPGMSEACAICYAVTMMRYDSVAKGWAERTVAPLPMIPASIEICRIHVAGDFDTVEYIQSWIDKVRAHPNVMFWAYTRSWRIPELLPSLERLRAEPNMQLFASTDSTISESTPTGWRVAYLETENYTTSGIVCPEQSGKKENCDQCKYCFKGQKGDVRFLPH